MPAYKSFYYRAICFVLIFAFLGSSVSIPEVKAGELVVPVMPVPGSMVQLSSTYNPAHLMGMTIHSDNALKFDFLIHKGDGNLTQDQKKQEYTKLVKYFLASLTIPDKDQWVNLSPYEKNRIIENNFGKTEMGRDLLGQDYLLKQITSSLMYPESGLGKTFWDKVYAEAYKKFGGSTSLTINTFNKVWIVPDKATVYESKNTVYVIESHLKVMLEEDYLAYRQAGLAFEKDKETREAGSKKQEEKTANTTSSNFSHLTSYGTLTSRIIKDIILPAIEHEVNEGKNFAQLRQIVSGMILATWYKKSLKESLLGKIYADKVKVSALGGSASGGKGVEYIYQQYLQAFKKGVYNYIKEDEDKYTHQIIPRKYFAGGFSPFKNVSSVDFASITPRQRDAAMALFSKTGDIEKAITSVDSFKNQGEIIQHDDHAMAVGKTGMDAAMNFRESMGRINENIHRRDLIRRIIPWAALIFVVQSEERRLWRVFHESDTSFYMSKDAGGISGLMAFLEQETQEGNSFESAWSRVTLDKIYEEASVVIRNFAKAYLERGVEAAYRVLLPEDNNDVVFKDNDETSLFSKHIDNILTIQLYISLARYKMIYPENILFLNQEMLVFLGMPQEYLNMVDDMFAVFFLIERIRSTPSLPYLNDRNLKYLIWAIEEYGFKRIIEDKEASWETDLDERAWIVKFLLRFRKEKIIEIKKIMDVDPSIGGSRVDPDVKESIWKKITSTQVRIRQNIQVYKYYLRSFSPEIINKLWPIVQDAQGYDIEWSNVLIKIFYEGKVLEFLKETKFNPTSEDILNNFKAERHAFSSKMKPPNTNAAMSSESVDVVRKSDAAMGEDLMVRLNELYGVALMMSDPEELLKTPDGQKELKDLINHFRTLLITQEDVLLFIKSVLDILNDTRIEEVLKKKTLMEKFRIGKEHENIYIFQETLQSIFLIINATHSEIKFSDLILVEDESEINDLLFFILELSGVSFVSPEPLNLNAGMRRFFEGESFEYFLSRYRLIVKITNIYLQLRQDFPLPEKPNEVEMRLIMDYLWSVARYSPDEYERQQLVDNYKNVIYPIEVRLNAELIVERLVELYELDEAMYSKIEDADTIYTDTQWSGVRDIFYEPQDFSLIKFKVDPAMGVSNEDLGGIDLNSANLAMTIKRDASASLSTGGNAVPLPLVQQDLAQLSQIEGFEPHILEITPVTNLPIINELKQIF